jgi:hypothetical protein
MTFFLLLGFLPISLVATLGHLAVLPGYWLASLLWPGMIIVLEFYAQRRCYFLMEAAWKGRVPNPSE